MLCKQETAEDGGKSFCRLKKVSLLAQHGVCKMGWDKKALYQQYLMMEMEKKRHSFCGWMKAILKATKKMVWIIKKHAGTSEVWGHKTTYVTHKSCAFQ